MTATWQGGYTYVPGSLVTPSTAPVPVPVAIPNGGFETGTLSSWTQTRGTWATNTTTPYNGTTCAQTGSSTPVGGTDAAELDMSTPVAVVPGQSITLSAFAKLTNAGTDNGYAAVQLIWSDASHAFISASTGNAITGKGGVYKGSTVTGIAPAGAAFVVARMSATAPTGGNVDFDTAAWNYKPTTAPPGLIFKATQAAPGKSGSSEPAWPATVGATVTDNQVIWTGVLATRLIWQASPLMTSGTTEPVWPAQNGGSVRDGSINWTAQSTAITDVNCPHSKIVQIAASKVYAADNDIIRYSATVNPLDWTSTNDAGYIAFGLQTYGSNPVAAMGLYRSNLVAFNAEGFQMWQLDPDPASIDLLDALPIASTYNRALSPVANDLLFLSSEGVRSVGIAASSTNLQAGDVGMPIDELVQVALAATIADNGDMISTFVPSLGQYWLATTQQTGALFTITGDLPNYTIGATIVPLQYQGHNGTAPYGPFSIDSGAVPTGLVLSVGGQLTGTITGSGTFTWVVKGYDAAGSVAYVTDTSTIYAVETLGIKPAVVSWWDFESNLLDQARGGNNQSGTGTYIPNATSTGNKLAAGTGPRIAATVKGFNYYAQGEYANFSMGARVTVSKLTNVTTLFSVGTDTGTAINPIVSVGINASGKWEFAMLQSAASTIVRLSSISSAAINTETYVGVSLSYGLAHSTMAIVINGVIEATTLITPAFITPGTPSFIVGTYEAGGYAPAISEMFWAHYTFASAEWLYLYNAGNKRFYADFKDVTYGTTYDAFIDSLISGLQAGNYKLNASSGTVAADSSTFAPIGNATLSGGALYSTAFAGPVGFGSDPVCYFNGTGAVIVNDTQFTSASGPIAPELMNVWVNQPTAAVAGSAFMAKSYNLGYNGRHLLRQGADATKVDVLYHDYAGNDIISSVGVMPGTNVWKMITFAAYGSANYAPIVNGIMAAAPAIYTPGMVRFNLNISIGAFYDGNLSVNAYMSRALHLVSANIPLRDLAKLYDLGSGNG